MKILFGILTPKKNSKKSQDLYEIESNEIQKNLHVQSKLKKLR